MAGMIICDNCRREWNTTALKRCPGCGATAAGVAPPTESLVTGAVSPRAVDAMIASRSRQVNNELLNHAEAVDSLASIVVVVAWITGIIGVGAGVILALAGLGSRAGGVSVVTGVAVAVQGLVAAVFIALFGRYAQMRASQARAEARR